MDLLRKKYSISKNCLYFLDKEYLNGNQWTSPQLDSLYLRIHLYYHRRELVSQVIGCHLADYSKWSQFVFNSSNVFFLSLFLPFLLGWLSSLKRAIRWPLFPPLTPYKQQLFEDFLVVTIIGGKYTLSLFDVLFLLFALFYCIILPWSLFFRTRRAFMKILNPLRPKRKNPLIQPLLQQNPNPLLFESLLYLHPNPFPPYFLVYGNLSIYFDILIRNVEFIPVFLFFVFYL